MKEIVRQWDSFWFQPADPLSLGFLRIATGMMLVYTHFVWGIKLEAFLGAGGFQDPLLVRELVPDTTAWSFWWYVPESMLWTVHWICLGTLVLYTLGLWTTVTKWAAPLITISYANRAPNANFGLDQINAMLALYLAIGPCGARLSLDRLWSTYRAGVRSLRDEGSYLVPEAAHCATARLSTRMIQVHMCVIYFFAGVSKLKGDAWWNGEAVWMALSNTEYQSRDLTWIAWYPWISDLITHATIIWEMTYWVFIWRPIWRPLYLFVGVLMHVGIGLFLGMWTFALIMISTYISYVPPELLKRSGRWLADVLPGGQKQILEVDSSSGLSIRRAALRKSFDWRGRLQVAVDGRIVEVPEAAPLQNAEPEFFGEDRVVGAMVAPPLMTAAQWWAAHKGTIRSWPFAPCERMDILRPRLVILHGKIDTLCGLQNYFLSKEFDCRAVGQVSEVCAALFERPCDVLLLMGQSPAEIEDILVLRDAMRQADRHAPVSVTIVPRFVGDSQNESEPDHPLLVGSVSFRELRHEVLRALQERTCTDEEAAVLAAQICQCGCGADESCEADSTDHNLGAVGEEATASTGRVVSAATTTSGETEGQT